MNTFPKTTIATLAVIFTLMPFAIDTYIPAIPQIALDLDTNSAYVAMTISLYIFGAAIGQLIGGQLSDKFGRVKVMITGLIVFSLSALFLANINTVWELWAGRIVQSLGAGIAIVGVPAIIRDNAEGQEASQLFTMIGFISILGPAIAPVIGAAILLNFNWHSIFIFLCIYGLFTSILCKNFLPKQAKPRQQTQKIHLFTSYLAVFKEKRAIGFLLGNALFFSSFFTYLINASVAYMDYFGVSEKLFTFLYTLNILFVIIVNRSNAYLLKSQQPKTIVQRFQKIQLAGTIFLLIITFLFPQILWLTVIGFIASACFNSGIAPNLNVLFMQYFPHNAGTASGVYGAFQAIISSIVSAGAAYLYNKTLIPMNLIIFICAISAFLLVRWQLHYNEKRK